MEAGPVTLTDDEVRDRFSAYRDGELPADEREAVRARLESSAELKAEYARFEKLMGALGVVSEGADRISLVGEGDHASDPRGATSGVREHTRAAGEGPVDLLAGVQARLHKRSKGRFYRDRFSRRAGVFPMELAAGAVLAVLVLAYVAMRLVSVSGP